MVCQEHDIRPVHNGASIVPLGLPLDFFFKLFILSCMLSRVQLFETPWTAAHQASLSFTISQSLFKTPRTVARQASLSMGFPRQKYWSELPFPLQGIFPTQGSNLGLMSEIILFS